MEGLDDDKAKAIKKVWSDSRFLHTHFTAPCRLKLRARKTEAEFRAMEYKFRAMHQELNKVFKDHQRVWKRLLKAPHCFSMSNPRWHPQGHESDSNDDDDSAPISDVDDNAVDPASEAPLRPRK